MSTASGRPSLQVVDGAGDIAPPALLPVGVRDSVGCMAGDDEDESLLDLDGSEHSIMCGVVDVSGAAARAVGKEGHAALALVGVADEDGVCGCGESLLGRHARFLEGRDGDTGVG